MKTAKDWSKELWERLSESVSSESIADIQRHSVLEVQAKLQSATPKILVWEMQVIESVLAEIDKGKV